MDRQKVIQDYWEQNVKKYSEFYDKTSEERIATPNWLAPIYRKTIFPFERKVTRDRYEMVKDFIVTQLQDGEHIVDLGCGGGIFTELLAEVGMRVSAFDFADSAIQMTKARVAKHASKVNVGKLNAMTEDIPKSDACICVGLFPYIENLDQLFSHVLPNTKKIWFNFLNDRSPSNLLRQAFPILNARYYYYHSPKQVRGWLANYGFVTVSETKLGTGLSFTAVRKDLLTV